MDGSGRGFGSGATSSGAFGSGGLGSGGLGGGASGEDAQAQARIRYLEERLMLLEVSLEDTYLSFSDDAACWQRWQRELSRNPKLRKTVKRCFPRMGDWDCTYCEALNFSRNDLCFVCGKRNAIADAESKAAWKAHPNDEEAHFRAVCQARADE
jgi:hypothetical protein